MTRFDDHFAEVGAPALMSQLGEPVQYLAPGQQPVHLTGIVGEERSEIETTDQGRQRVRTLEVMVLTDPNSDYGGIASPAENAELVVRNETWPVIDKTVTATMITFRLQLKGSVEYSRPRYRGR